MWSNFIKRYFLLCAMANHGVSNIVSTNNVLLPEGLVENWNLIQMIGEFADNWDVLNWLAKRLFL